MSYSFSFRIPKALPSLSSHHRKAPLHPASNNKLLCNKNKSCNKQNVTSTSREAEDCNEVKKSSLAIQLAAVLATVEQPAFAVTGVNNEEDLSWILIQSAIAGFIYFILMPPIIMNWLRIRWYRRNLLEMYLQFMFVFIFFPGVLLWAPFLNFRKFPRDPSMKYPWSTPENPSQIKNGFLKYPLATPEEYDQ
uniref:NADPH-quinone oxidoreductase subunit Lic n=1 Tax=Rhizophora mucronata TaxID=61149 RepID=A0A2P2JXT4_RHIMU